MRRKISLILVLLMLFALAACAKTEAPQQSAQPSPTERVEKEITIAAGRSFYQGPTTNIFVHGSTNVWQALVMLDENMGPEMKLAESATQSEDGLTWTIRLRPGITFHDGSRLTSEVAVFNLDRLYRWNSGSKSYDSEFEKDSEYGKIVDMSVVDEQTFTVTHEKPIPDFDLRLAYENSAMFALSSFDENKAITFPYGTGPYKYDSYDEVTQALTLVKFDEYWEGEPKLDKVVFRNIADATARLSALRSGEVQVISDVGGIMPQQAATVLADEGLIMKQRLVSTVHYYALNTNEGRLFSDVNMRKALSLSIDRKTIVDKLLLGYGEPAISVLSSAGADWVIDCGYSFDPVKAKALKEEAVGEGEVSCTILLNSALLGRWPYQDTASMIQAQLGEIGINAKIETVDGATWNSRLKEGSYDIAPQPFTVSAGEPNYFFVRNIESRGANNVARSYGISDPVLDELIEKVAVEPDKSERQNLYKTIQGLVKENEYIIPLWYDVTLYAMKKNVQNFNLDVIFCPNLFEVELA
ncbi:MAG TPA: ABC transporter substrate-binding protein [Clostridiales bacterium]|jgi:peptide/nickel transport system substrate-binding protein|nr:ABC transporter substrate-binding protein [Clostridiales bacterium]